MEVHFPTWWSSEMVRERGWRKQRCKMPPLISSLPCSVSPAVPDLPSSEAHHRAACPTLRKGYSPFHLDYPMLPVIPEIIAVMNQQFHYPALLTGPLTNQGKRCSVLQNVTTSLGWSTAKVARFSSSDFKSTDFYLMLLISYGVFCLILLRTTERSV